MFNDSVSGFPQAVMQSNTKDSHVSPLILYFDNGNSLLCDLVVSGLILQFSYIVSPSVLNDAFS